MWHVIFVRLLRFITSREDSPLDFFSRVESVAPQQENDNHFWRKWKQTERFGQPSAETRRVVLVIRTDVFIRIVFPNILFLLHRNLHLNENVDTNRIRCGDRAENDLPAGLYLKPQGKSACSLYTSYTKPCTDFITQSLLFITSWMQVNPPPQGSLCHTSHYGE